MGGGRATDAEGTLAEEWVYHYRGIQKRTWGHPQGTGLRFSKTRGLEFWASWDMGSEILEWQEVG